jgi:hypothetical protein
MQKILNYKEKLRIRDFKNNFLNFYLFYFNLILFFTNIKMKFPSLLPIHLMF